LLIVVTLLKLDAERSAFLIQTHGVEFDKTLGKVTPVKLVLALSIYNPCQSVTLDKLSPVKFAPLRFEFRRLVTLVKLAPLRLLLDNWAVMVPEKVAFVKVLELAQKFPPLKFGKIAFVKLLEVKRLLS
jgi:hypothetical protein